MATHSSILAEKTPWTRVAWQATSPWDHKESDMTEQTGKDGLDWWFSGKEPACHCRRSLGWQDPLDKGMAACSSILAGESHGQRSLAGCSLWGHKELDRTQQLHNDNKAMGTWERRWVHTQKETPFTKG